MSTPFDGTWIGERQIPIQVTSKGYFLEIQLGDAAPFVGFTPPDTQPALIYSQWGGATLYTGTLAADGDSVRWDNDTAWLRLAS